MSGSGIVPPGVVSDRQAVHAPGQPFGNARRASLRRLASSRAPLATVVDPERPGSRPDRAGARAGHAGPPADHGAARRVVGPGTDASTARGTLCGRPIAVGGGVIGGRSVGAPRAAPVVGRPPANLSEHRAGGGETASAPRATAPIRPGASATIKRDWRAGRERPHRGPRSRPRARPAGGGGLRPSTPDRIGARTPPNRPTTGPERLPTGPCAVAAPRRGGSRAARGAEMPPATLRFSAWRAWPWS